MTVDDATMPEVEAGEVITPSDGSSYYEMLADGRAGGWYAVAKLPPPTNRAIIIAKPREGKRRGWFLARAKWDGHAWVDPDAPDVRYSAAYVTHWREDTIGTPPPCK